MGSFFIRVRSIFFVHLFNNLNYGCSKHTRTSEPRPKQNRRPGPRKHTKDPYYLAIFFDNTRLFENFSRGFGKLMQCITISADKFVPQKPPPIRRKWVTKKLKRNINKRDHEFMIWFNDYENDENAANS